MLLAVPYGLREVSETLLEQEVPCKLQAYLYERKSERHCPIWIKYHQDLWRLGSGPIVSATSIAADLLWYAWKCNGELSTDSGSFKLWSDGGTYILKDPQTLHLITRRTNRLYRIYRSAPTHLNTTLPVSLRTRCVNSSMQNAVATCRSSIPNIHLRGEEKRDTF